MLYRYRSELTDCLCTERSSDEYFTIKSGLVSAVMSKLMIYLALRSRHDLSYASFFAYDFLLFFTEELILVASVSVYWLVNFYTYKFFLPVATTI